MDIQWQIICYSLKRFKSSECQILLKFILEWLPIQNCHHIWSPSCGHSCPSCCQTTETNDHFLSCQHDSRLQVWKDLHEQLHQHQIKHTISNIFHDLLALASILAGANPPISCFITYCMTSMYSMISRKALAGNKFITDSSPHVGLTYWRPTTHRINGVTYYTKCLMLIWQADTESTPTPKVLWIGRLQHTQSSHSLNFHKARQDPILQEMIKHIEPDQILSHPTHWVWWWVTNSNNHIQAHLKAIQLFAKLFTQDIWQFFPKNTGSITNSIG